MEHFISRYQVAPSANVITTGEEHDDYNTSAAAESHLIHLFCVINKNLSVYSWRCFCRSRAAQFTGQLKMSTRECLVHHFTHMLGIS